MIQIDAVHLALIIECAALFMVSTVILFLKNRKHKFEYQKAMQQIFALRGTSGRGKGSRSVKALSQKGGARMSARQHLGKNRTEAKRPGARRSTAHKA
ncbi:MAG: hypothetical protein WC539_04920 [Nitrospirota bacterium]